MGSPSQILTFLALATLGLAAPRQPPSESLSTPKAVYFLTNQGPNAVVALKVNSNGTLTSGSITATGGEGVSGIPLANGLPVGNGSLFSQGGVTIAGQSLFAVNAGSNTLSMFHIDAEEPTNLQLIGRPINTLGDLPNSVDVSESLGQACVLNSGTHAGIACFGISEDGLRPLDQNLGVISTVNTTTPPTVPAFTASNIFFNHDTSAVIVPVKGSASPHKPGSLSVFPVVEGKVSYADVQSIVVNSTLLFGGVNVPGTSSIFASEATIGGLIIDINSVDMGNTIKTVNVIDNMASCWTIYASKTQSVFITDPHVPHLVEIDPITGSILSNVYFTNTSPGLIDLAAGGDYVYALSAGGADFPVAVTVFDISGGRGSAKTIQNFVVSNVAPYSPQGMAVYL